MALYFFDTDSGKTAVHDEIGTELPDEQAARDEAAETLAAMARDYIPGAEQQANITMWVRNADGTPLLQMALSFAIKRLS